MPHMKGFLAAYPDIRLDATLTDETVNLIESGADVGVRIGALVDSVTDREPGNKAIPRPAIAASRHRGASRNRWRGDVQSRRFRPAWLISDDLRAGRLVSLLPKVRLRGRRYCRKIDKDPCKS